MGLPPFDGAVQATVALSVPAVADTAVGAPGAPAGTLVSVNVASRPTTLGTLAVTVKAPAMPFAVNGVAVATPVVPVTTVAVDDPATKVALAPVTPATAVNSTGTPPSRTGAVPFLRLAPRWIGKTVPTGELCLSPPEMFRRV